MTRRLVAWLPVLIFTTGLVLIQTVEGQQRMPLRIPLADAVPRVLFGAHATDVEISEYEQRVAGMSSYVMRLYENAGGQGFTVYVGYYDSQTEGREIHSPRNCLPGAGWESVVATRSSILVDGAPVTVNQHVIRRGDEHALVLYWYQGRGRVAANEVAIKWQLVRDAALHRRTDEALVRIVVPITAADDGVALAHRVAAQVIPSVYSALPAAGD